MNLPDPSNLEPYAYAVFLYIYLLDWMWCSGLVFLVVLAVFVLQNPKQGHVKTHTIPQTFHSLFEEESISQGRAIQWGVCKNIVQREKKSEQSGIF